MHLHTGALPGDEAVPDGRVERWMEVTLIRGRWRQCQSGISDGQEDRGNYGRFLYRHRGSTAEKGSSMVPAGQVERGERM